MLIDSLSIHYSGRVANVVIPAPTVESFILGFRDLLVSVGWTDLGGVFATATITFPLGAPITAGVTATPKAVVGCNAPPGFLGIGGQVFTLYDPYTEIPAVGVTCIMVEEDLTAAGTLTNLAAAVTAFSPFDAVLSQQTSVHFTMDFTAKVAGPVWNFVPFSSAAGFYVAGGDRSNGGGFLLESAPGASIYQVTIANANSHGAGIAYLAGNLLFDFNFNGSHFSYQLLDGDQGTLGFMGALGVGAVDQYTVIADPHGFVVFDEPRNTSSHLFRSVTLFAMAPYIPGSEIPPQENFVTPVFAAFAVGQNDVGGPPAWLNSSVACLDGTPFENFGHNASPRLLALRSPEFPLLTPHGTPITIGPYVMFGTDTNSVAWIIGKLWDCALVSDFVDTGAIIEGRKFLTIGYSDGTNHLTQCTLLMACGETFIPDPPNPPPAPPAPPKSGVVNLFGDGVTWVSGDKFTVDMEGKPITINGDSYIVLTFINDENLTLNTAKTIAPGATYTAP